MKPSKKIILAIFSAALATSAPAQSPAPIPSQLLTAKTVFIANTGSADNQYCAMVYNDFYQNLAGSSDYTLKASPAEAELALEVSLDEGIIAITNGEKPLLRITLTIRDIKTGTALWRLTETVEGAFRSKTYAKNINDATLALTQDLLDLTTPPPPPASSSATPAPAKPTHKTRLSDEGK